MIVIIPLSLLTGFLLYLLRPRSTDRKHACLIGFGVSIFSFVIALSSVVIQILHNMVGDVSVSAISNNLFVIGFFSFGTGILTAIVLLITGKREIARNIGFGLCITFYLLVIELGLLEWLGGV